MITAKGKVVGGARPNSGRKPGPLKEAATRRAAQTAAAASILPLDVLLKTCEELWVEAVATQDPKLRRALQMEACAVAKDAAPYLHARLQATTIKGDPENPLAILNSLPDSAALKAAIRGREK